MDTPAQPGASAPVTAPVTVKAERASQGGRTAMTTQDTSARAITTSLTLAPKAGRVRHLRTKGVGALHR